MVLLNSPVHGGVGDDERRSDVENLVSESPEGVEESSVGGTSQGALTVGRQRVGGDALGGRATEITPGTEENSVLRIQVATHFEGMRLDIKRLEMRRRWN